MPTEARVGMITVLLLLSRSESVMARCFSNLRVSWQGALSIWECHGQEAHPVRMRLQVARLVSSMPCSRIQSRTNGFLKCPGSVRKCTSMPARGSSACQRHWHRRFDRASARMTKPSQGFTILVAVRCSSALHASSKHGPHQPTCCSEDLPGYSFEKSMPSVANARKSEEQKMPCG